MKSDIGSTFDIHNQLLNEKSPSKIEIENEAEDMDEDEKLLKKEEEERQLEVRRMKDDDKHSKIFDLIMRDNFCSKKDILSVIDFKSQTITIRNKRKKDLLLETFKLLKGTLKGEDLISILKIHVSLKKEGAILDTFLKKEGIEDNVTEILEHYIAALNGEMFSFGYI